MMRKLFVLLWAMMATVAAHAAAQPGVSPGDINAAGELRMLSQRLARSYVQLGLEVVPAAALEQLQDSIVRFERNLERMQVLAAGVPPAGPSIERLRGDWAALRAAVAEPADRTRALLASRRSLDVLESADRLVVTLEAAANGVGARRINQAGSLRMLSQRVVKAYMLYSWGADTAASRREMESAADEFGRGLTTLAALPGNTADMRTELAEIALQWEWLRTALSVEGAGSYRLIAAEAADSILAATDRLVRLYERPESR
ncbi:type IV pili methyl-accepting chemotaxis transducer N-terminal domain-containing protein [Aromatoleum toluclasticum]|uniref:type IV pili methyl-accepting chemotaxis transducer N-terminal domain-containing protein n=1 Tax=Aromatoleum toluclasticum TaxID=92003 RepID=UPI000372DEF9|nr:type IV pili methyl-accepting chemotaxis transducer N-terminal domain-containing protein [Aromatoleum toluclasticum]MCC4114296.1 type IV pili methyl-accepting chemotaxis transducer N-terminal domain-containing protein [Aromatoleum toluclasticum]